MKRFEDYRNEQIRTFNGTTAKAEDYLRLKPEECSDDSVIEAFRKSMAVKNIHAANHIIIILNSLIRGHV